MLELNSIPSFDWLSEWKAGTPWIDFEWLTQLVYLGIHRFGGMTGLWAFKIALLIAAAFIFWKTLELYRIPVAYRAAGLAAWFTAQIVRSDIRPELFSIIGFSLLFLVLEARRLGSSVPSPLWAVPFFCLWANLHLGMAYGLLLIAVYAVVESLGKMRSNDFRQGVVESMDLWFLLTAATVGSFLQPFGIKLYQVLWQHWVEMASMSLYISEWKGITLRQSLEWPYWMILVFGFGSVLAYWFRVRRMTFAPLAMLLYCGYSASQHSRLTGYYIAVGLPLGFYWLKSARLLPPESFRNVRWGSLVVIILCAAFSVWSAERLGMGKQIFSARHTPIRMAEFLASEKAVLKKLSLYNEWGWGGYLAYRLYPDFRIFQDGRYIFHSFIKEQSQAVANPKSWQEFLNRYGMDLVLLLNMPLKFSTVRQYPDGSTRSFLRPFYVLFMPKDQWALAHWDDHALVFVRRSAVPRSWLEAHEYRYARPWDDEALQDILARKEIPRADWEAELRRHQSESEKLLPPKDLF